MSLVRTNLFLSKEQRTNLVKIAARKGLSEAALIRRVLDSFLGIEVKVVEPIQFKKSLPKK